MPIFDMKSVGQRQLQDLIDNKVFENKELNLILRVFPGKISVLFKKIPLFFADNQI